MTQSEKIGGTSYLLKLAHEELTAVNVGFYIGVLEDKYTLRQAIHATEQQIELAYESDDAGMVVNSMLNDSAALSNQASLDEDFTPIKKVLFKVIESTEERCENVKNGITSGLYTGYRDFDGITAGLHKGELIIVAAHPSVGKTAFAVNIAQNVAVKTGETVAIFSLEV